MLAGNGRRFIVGAGLALAACGRSSGSSVDARDVASASPDLQPARDLPAEYVDAAADVATFDIVPDSPVVGRDTATPDLAIKNEDAVGNDVGRKDSSAGVERTSAADGGVPSICRGTLAFGGLLPISDTGGRTSYYGTPIFLGVADLNRDNKLDMVIANSESATVGVLIGKGDGTFAKVATYGTGSPYANDMDSATGPLSVAVGDLDGDGKPDIVSANTSPGTVSVLLAKGDGTFAPHVEYGCGKKPYHVVLGDMDGDEMLDIVTANYDSDTVSVLLGKGDGTFAAKLDSATGDGPRTAVLGDVNGDGKLDVVTTNVLASTVSVLLGAGDGSLGDKRDFPLGGTPSSLLAATALGDLNADDKLDLVVATGQVSVMLGTGDGSFAEPVSYPAGSDSPSAVALGDLNGDGKPDVLAITNSSIAVLLGQGDGTLGNRRNFPPASRPAMAVIADMNGDRTMDVAIAFLPPYIRTAGVLLGNGDGTFASSRLDWAKHYPIAMATADLNGDGRPDIVLNCQSDGVSVLLGTGDSGFAIKADYTVGPSTSTGPPASIEVGDLNGDGKLDVVTATHDRSASSGTGIVTVLLGNGDAAFADPSQVATSFEPYSLKLGDLNGDHKPDMVMTNHEGGKVSVRLGNGDGTFADAVDYVAGTGPTQLALGDLDRDGKVDIVLLTDGYVSGYSSGTSVVLLLGKGDGTFAARRDLSTGGSATSLALADLNGDGKLDVVGATGSIIGGTVSVWMGNGDGTLANRTDFATGGSYARLGPIADFNRDGKLDVTAVDKPDPGYGGVGMISLLLGNGDGTLAASIDYPVDDLTLAAADLNGDGRVDLFGASDSGSVDILFGSCQ
jgi:hypothetical protein